MRFSLYFYEFLTILNLSIFFSKISADISVKSKYRYIRDYRYFHPWLQECGNLVFVLKSNWAF